MDVNLKLPQDVGANGYASPVKQGGFSVKSTPENVSTSRMVASSIPTVMFFASLFGFSMRAGGGFMRGGKR